MNELDAIRIRTGEDVNAACGQPIALIYKHSPYCGSSRRAAHEVQRFSEGCPEVPVYVVDVVGERSLSLDIAARLGVRHESPQVILVVDGSAAWDESHAGIRVDALIREAASRRH